MIYTPVTECGSANKNFTLTLFLLKKKRKTVEKEKKNRGVLRTPPCQ
jgi:hypothetical protein